MTSPRKTLPASRGFSTTARLCLYCWTLEIVPLTTSVSNSRNSVPRATSQRLSQREPGVGFAVTRRKVSRFNAAAPFCPIEKPWLCPEFVSHTLKVLESTQGNANDFDFFIGQRNARRCLCIARWKILEAPQCFLAAVHKVSGCGILAWWPGGSNRDTLE